MKNPLIIGFIREWQATGCIKSRNEAVMSFDGAIHHCIRKYKVDEHLYQDLYQEGILGVIHAINKFDCERGLEPITYVMHWIKFFLQKVLADKYNTVWNLTDRCPTEDLNDLVPQSTGPSEIVEYNETMEVIAEVILSFEPNPMGTFVRRLDGSTFKHSGLPFGFSCDKFFYEKGLVKLKEALNV